MTSTICLKAGPLVLWKNCNLYLISITSKKNSTSVEEFHGLSPDQMHRFPPICRLNRLSWLLFRGYCQLNRRVKLRFFSICLSRRSGKRGIKLTAKGNLGQKFCQKARKVYFDLFPETFNVTSFSAYRNQFRTSAHHPPYSSTCRVDAKIQRSPGSNEKVFEIVRTWRGDGSYIRS